MCVCVYVCVYMCVCVLCVRMCVKARKRTVREYQFEAKSICYTIKITFLMLTTPLLHTNIPPQKSACRAQIHTHAHTFQYTDTHTHMYTHTYAT